MANEPGGGEKKGQEERIERVKEGAALGWLVTTVLGAISMSFSKEDSALNTAGCVVLLANGLVPPLVVGTDMARRAVDRGRRDGRRRSKEE